MSEQDVDGKGEVELLAMKLYEIAPLYSAGFRRKEIWYAEWADLSRGTREDQMKVAEALIAAGYRRAASKEGSGNDATG